MTGHLAELRQQLNILKNYALSTGKTLPELVQKFLANSDGDIVFQGKILSGMIAREIRFQEALNAIQTAGPLMKPFYFFKYFQTSIAEEAYGTFVFGFPVTFESFYYAVAGIGFGMLVIKTISFIFHLSTKREPDPAKGRK